MQYLLLCCFEERAWERLPQAQREAVMQKYGEFVQSTIASGHYVAGAKLRDTSAATTVRAKNGRAAIVDGPFAETKEQLGGYHLIDCRDLDEAIAIAQRIPTLEVGGTVEVRPVESVVQR